MPILTETQQSMTPAAPVGVTTSSPAPQIKPTMYGMEGATTELGPQGGQQSIVRGDASSPSLSQFYPSGVPATTAAVAPDKVDATMANVQNATAAAVDTPGEAEAKDAVAGQVTGGPTEMSSAQQLANITSQDSPTMARARQVGKQVAGRRGLLNSTIASQQAAGAMVDRALPLAQQDAATATALAQSAADRETQVSSLNAQLGTDVSKFNAQQLNEAEMLAAQMETAVSQGNAEAYNRAQQQFADLQTRADLTNADQSFRASQQFAQERNAMIQATQAQIQELNKQFLAGSQAIDLAQIQGQYNTLISKNEAAARVFDSYLSGMSQIMSNKDISPSRVAQYVQTQLKQVQGALGFIQDMDNTDLSSFNANIASTIAPIQPTKQAPIRPPDKKKKTPKITVGGGGKGKDSGGFNFGGGSKSGGGGLDRGPSTAGLGGTAGLGSMRGSFSDMGGGGYGGGSSGGGGGGGGGSGKVICTALNNAYDLPPIYARVWMKHDRTLGNGELAELGYHKLFYPLAKRLKSHPRIARLMKHIVKVRTARLRREMAGKRPTLQQWLYKAILRPPCIAVGWLINEGILEKTNVRG